MSFTHKWACNSCKETVEVNTDDYLEIGTPTCDECSCEMERLLGTHNEEDCKKLASEIVESMGVNQLELLAKECYVELLMEHPDKFSEWIESLKEENKIS